MKSIFSVLMLVLGANAYAGIIDGDLYTQGDRLIAYDTETGLEWLDLSQTKGKSINDVKALLSTSLNGWRVPTGDEVRAMLQSAFYNTTFNNSSTRYTYDEQTATEFNLAFGATGFSNGKYISVGLFKDDDGRVKNAGVVPYQTTVDIRYPHHESIYSENWKYSHDAVFLVSDQRLSLTAQNALHDAPVSAFFGLSLLAFGFGRLRNF